jgi:sugar lactone lactonase YvrE
MKRFLLLFCLVVCYAPVVTADQDSAYSIHARLLDAPGNITVTVDNRIILSLHQFYEPNYSVVELLEDGSLIPFPNEEMNQRTSSTILHLDSVLGIRSDMRGVVWMLDNGMRGGTIPKLVGWDSRDNALVKVIELPPPVTPKDAFVNDFAIDSTRNRIYISDPAGGANAALIVVDLITGMARRVLDGHASVVPEFIDLVIDGQPLKIKDAEGKINHPHIGVNPITLDLNNQWVYFGAMHGKSIYRVKAEDLSNDALSSSELNGRVERYSDKPICDGISIDKDNNIYLGELAANALGVITPDRKYHRLAQGDDLSWVDAFSFGPGGTLYAVVNRLHQTAMLNAGKAVSKPPYFVVLVKAYTEGMAGR